MREPEKLDNAESKDSLPKNEAKKRSRKKKGQVIK
jgi:hypothetical protein